MSYSKDEQLQTNRLRKRKCKTCREWFRPVNEIQRTCMTPECAVPFARELEAKQNKLRLKKFKQNDKSELMKTAQREFNKYIRLRDKDKPCISCSHTGDRQRHASHYRPVGRNSKHRFNEMNVHSACSICNAHLSGNLIPYREAMIKMYGIKMVEELESDNEPHRYTVGELKDIINKYRKKIKDIESEL